MTHRTLLRLMAGFCVGLALVCMTLALAYERKSAELNAMLTPPNLA